MCRPAHVHLPKRCPFQLAGHILRWKRPNHVWIAGSAGPHPRWSRTRNWIEPLHARSGRGRREHCINHRKPCLPYPHGDALGPLREGTSSDIRWDHEPAESFRHPRSPGRCRTEFYQHLQYRGAEPINCFRIRRRFRIDRSDGRRTAARKSTTLSVCELYYRAGGYLPFAKLARKSPPGALAGFSRSPGLE